MSSYIHNLYIFSHNCRELPAAVQVPATVPLDLVDQEADDPEEFDEQDEFSIRITEDNGDVELEIPEVLDQPLPSFSGDARTESRKIVTPGTLTVTAAAIQSSTAATPISATAATSALETPAPRSFR